MSGDFNPLDVAAGGFLEVVDINHTDITGAALLHRSEMELVLLLHIVFSGAIGKKLTVYARPRTSWALPRVKRGLRG